MAAVQQAIEALKPEVGQQRQEFESISPKFGGYGLMVQANGPWKIEVERMLKEQAADAADQAAFTKTQGGTIASLQYVYSKCDACLTEISTKLQNSQNLVGGEKNNK